MVPKAKMDKGRYPPRECLVCKENFRPVFPNQQIHPKCKRSWKLSYFRDYQRKLRKDLKRGWDE